MPVFTCLGCISKSGIAGMVTLFTFFGELHCFPLISDFNQSGAVAKVS